MDRIRIAGGNKLHGQIAISGAKNAALPLMIASLLTPDRLTLKNVPNLADVNLLARILRNHGLDHTVDGKRAGAQAHIGETYHFDARDIVDTTAPYELVSRMRAIFCWPSIRRPCSRRWTGWRPIWRMRRPRCATRGGRWT